MNLFIQANFGRILKETENHDFFFTFGTFGLFHTLKINSDHGLSNPP